jgi:hypothetical protein
MTTVPQDPTLRAAYVCAAFSADPVSNTRRVQLIARCLIRAGYLPIVPHLLFPPILNEATERDLALRLCLRLVQLVDEVQVYGSPTEGMRLEIAAANQSGIPVRLGYSDE